MKSFLVLWISKLVVLSLSFLCRVHSFEVCYITPNKLSSYKLIYCTHPCAGSLSNANSANHLIECKRARLFVFVYSKFAQYLQCIWGKYVSVHDQNAAHPNRIEFASFGCAKRSLLYRLLSRMSSGMPFRRSPESFIQTSLTGTWAFFPLS
jgi:hypothetical protein